MYPHLFHIYGSIYANNYGLFIAIAIVVFCFFIKKDPKFNKITSFDNFKLILIWAIIVGAIGGRLLWLIEEKHLVKNYWEFFQFWLPGYSFLGTLLVLMCFMPIYLKILKIQIWTFLDVVAIYAPLLHSIARIGCFLAGCCHGIPTNSNWGIIYAHPDVAVPDNLKYIKLHPTQIYTSVYLFILFLLMYYLFQKKLNKEGQLFSIYLIFTSLERFFNDFYRADREFYNFISLNNIISTDQLLSLLILFIGLFLYLQSTYKLFSFKNKQQQHL